MTMLRVLFRIMDHRFFFPSKVITSLGICKSLAESIGPSVVRHKGNILPNMLSTLTDAKVFFTTQIVFALDIEGDGVVRSINGLSTSKLNVLSIFNSILSFLVHNSFH